MQSKYLLIIASLVVQIGCKTAQTRAIPLPPLYDNDCGTSHTHYAELAFDTQDLAPEGSISSDPQEALDAALKWIEDWELANGSKIEIVQKSKLGIEQFDRFTTTLPTRIYVKDRFFDGPIRYQAEVLWHEIVHVRQWTRLGTALMAELWLSPHGRMALETVAYRESARMRILFGETPESIVRYSEGRAKSLYEGYALQTIPWDCYRPQVVNVLTADLAQ